MKSLLIMPVLAQVASSASIKRELFADFAKPQDAGSVVQKLTGMMAASKQALALAEHRHAKVVKKVRKEAGVALNEEAKVYGNYINGYSAELTKAENEYLRVLDSARKGLAAAEAAPTNLNDWKDPDALKKAKLNAQVASADRAVKRAERRRGRQVREAEERGEEALEDEAQKLAMKVGDMTPLVEEAKKTLDATAEKTAPVASDLAAAKGNSSVGKKVNLTALETDLEKATAKHQAATTGANTKLDNFLAKTGKDVATKMQKLEDKFEIAQRDEISKVTDKKQAAAKTSAKKSIPAKPAVVKAKGKAAAKPAQHTQTKIEEKKVVAKAKVAVKPAQKVPTKTANTKAAVKK